MHTTISILGSRRICVFSSFLSPSSPSFWLTRQQNEVQISSVCTFGWVRPLIPGYFSHTLVFPVYRHNEEEYSPPYPHHSAALSHSRAVERSQKQTSVCLHFTNIRWQQCLVFRLKHCTYLPAVPRWAGFWDPWAAKWRDARNCIQIFLFSLCQPLKSKQN